MRIYWSSLVISSLLWMATPAFGQTTYNSDVFSLTKVRTVTPDVNNNGLDAQWLHLEMPSPNGTSYKSFLASQKIKGKKQFAPSKQGPSNQIQSSLPDPIISASFGMEKYNAIYDSLIPLTGGIPLDNTIAINKDSILLGSVNSYLWAYDLRHDSNLFKDQIGSSATISFGQFAGSQGIDTDFPFDPKLMYVPTRDRFVFMFLSGRTPTDTKTVVGFSSTNDPRDEWYIYEIPGNPRGGNFWSDYPAFSIGENELFYTVNIIADGVSWQEGFRGTVIWQLPIEACFDGAENVDMVLYDDIKYDGKYIRNLNPIENYNGVLPAGEAHFVSNRNFDLSNDTLFYLKLNQTNAGEEFTLQTDIIHLDQPYGVPPNGIQTDTDLNDPTSGLQTNDARWLGGFLLEDKIHCVGNTRSFETGRAAIYHAILEGVNTEETITATGQVIGLPEMDFGYPNIMFTGKEMCDNQAIIAFNHTDTLHPAGISCLFYQNGEYSDVVKLKEGFAYVDKWTGPEERWGDYFGMQIDYSDPGAIWTGGFYGLANNNSSTWFNKVHSPRSLEMNLEIDTSFLSVHNICDGEINWNVTNAQLPLTQIWNGTEVTENTQPISLCDGEFTLEIIDARNCRITKAGTFSVVVDNTNVYPNPFNDRLEVDFELTSDEEVVIYMYDAAGKLVKILGEKNGMIGTNRFSFSTYSLESGFYYLVVQQGENEIVNKPLIKY